jgi:Cys-tRNA(Pro)/Cys-tRNA(Cys) deacylase
MSSHQGFSPIVHSITGCRATINSMNSATLPAVQYLRERSIPHRLFQHAGPIQSLEQAAAERSQQPEQVVRSIVFRLGEGEFRMVLMAGPGQVPWKALRKHLGQSRLTMASDEELFEATGCLPGTVTPFGLPRPMRVLVDQGVLTQSEVSLGSGQRGLAIIMQPADLIRALDQALVETVNFSAA